MTDASDVSRVIANERRALPEPRPVDPSEFIAAAMSTPATRRLELRQFLDAVAVLLRGADLERCLALSALIADWALLEQLSVQRGSDADELRATVAELRADVARLARRAGGMP